MKGRIVQVGPTRYKAQYKHFLIWNDLTNMLLDEPWGEYPTTRYFDTFDEAFAALNRWYKKYSYKQKPFKEVKINVKLD